MVGRTSVRERRTGAVPAVGDDAPLPVAGPHVLDGVGHWTQQERPEAVNTILIDWLKRL